MLDIKSIVSLLDIVGTLARLELLNALIVNNNYFKFAHHTVVVKD